MKTKIMPQNNKELQKLAEELKIYRTVWAIDNTNFNDVAFDESIKFVAYSCFGHYIRFPLRCKQTWKEVWSTVDYMVMCVEMGDHQWIESFDIDEEGVANLFLGS